MVDASHTTTGNKMTRNIYDPNELLKRIYDDHNKNYDLYLNNEEVYTALNSDNFEFVESAMQQLLNRIRVPKQFFDRCESELQDHILTDFLKNKSSEFLVRFTGTDDLSTHQARAILSNKYGVIDHISVFPNVLDALVNESFNITNVLESHQILFVQIDFPECSLVHEGDKYTAGLAVTNSETGHSAVWIEPVVRSNNMIFANRSRLPAEGVNCRLIHKGSFNTEQLRSMIQQCKDIAQVGVVQLLEAKNDMITTDHAMQYVSRLDGFSKKLADTVKAEWEQRQQISRLEVTRKILELAQELPVFQRLLVTQQASRVTNLFKDYQSKLNSIVNSNGQ